MEKNKSIEATQLPEEIIQHIQSFLSGEEAAQTTILSKSWYNAWLTRPNLDLDEYVDMIWEETPPSESVFLKLANNTMQRYEQLNLNIHSFSLKMEFFKQNIECSYTYNKLSLANEWTTRAMKLGAIDIEIQCRDYDNIFVLPHEVLESETLVKLSFFGGRIDLRDLHKVSCSRLKSLRLSGVCIEGDNLWDLISMCPSIEEFVLFSYVKLELKPRLGVNDFHKLKVLSFYYVEFGEWFFRDLSSKFPCLKKLTLEYCTGYQEIQICSNSLECIDFDHGGTPKLRVQLEVPRIRTFKYSSFDVPSLTFKTISREWQYDISFLCNVDSSWFVELRNFLMELKSAKISLTLWIISSVEDVDHYVNHTIGLLEPPIVQKVAFGMGAPSSFRSTFSEELFWTCCSNSVVICSTPDFVNHTCNTLIKQECENVIMSSLYDLEEVNVHMSGGTKWTWSRPLPTRH